MSKGETNVFELAHDHQSRISPDLGEGHLRPDQGTAAGAPEGRRPCEATGPNLAALSDAESLRRMISFTKREAEMKDRTFCAYLLDLALSALDEDSEEMNLALRARITPMPDLERSRKPRRAK